MSGEPEDALEEEAPRIEEVDDGPPTPTEDRRARRIVAVGGGKGGVGKSLIAANIGIHLAQLGKRVVLFDADLGGANLHSFVGVERARRTLGDYFAKRVNRVEDCVLETPVSGLGLLSGEGDPVWAANPRPATKNRLMRDVQELDVDYIICDLPTGSGFTALDFFLMADVGLLVVVPEPTSVENTTRFIKSAFRRRVRSIEGISRLPLDQIAGTGIASPLDIYRAAREGDEELARSVLEEIHRFRPRLVVNQVRTRSDLELGPQLRSAGRRRLGLAVDYLGHLEADDAVWLAIRKRRPLVVDHPEAKVSKDIERIARKLIALEAEKDGPPVVPRPTEEQTLYEVLELDPGASDEEIRRAHKRARDIYAFDSMVVAGLYTREYLEAVHRRLEESYSTLLDPERRRRYDMGLFPEDAVPSRPPSKPAPAPHEEGPAPIPVPDITPETEFTGDLLRRIREARGLTLDEIAQTTRIGIAHLRAIEDERFDALPVAVYLRGFVQWYAKCLRLDPGRVAQSFLLRYNAGRKVRDD